MLFRTIVADPPWRPAISNIHGPRGVKTNKASPQKHYPVMSVAEICKIVLPPTCPQAHLWLWVLSQHVDWGHIVAKAWGFRVWQMITWCKPGLGVGQFQCNTEHVLICRKGPRVGNPFGRTGGTWFEWARGRHSEKPAAFYVLVESVSPGPYFEMFARAKQPGWCASGDQLIDQTLW